jgi:hypothetical protein
MQTREFIVSALIGCALAIAMNGTAFALTPEEKRDIYARCTDAGGTFKACCAAAGGTVKVDPQTGSSYCDWFSSKEPGEGLRRAPSPGVQRPESNETTPSPTSPVKPLPKLN